MNASAASIRRRQLASKAANGRPSGGNPGTMNMYTTDDTPGIKV